MKKRRIVFRGSFNGDEVRLEAGSSVIEAGKFPTDEKMKNFEHPAFGGKIELRRALADAPVWASGSFATSFVNDAKLVPHLAGRTFIRTNDGGYSRVLK